MWDRFSHKVVGEATQRMPQSVEGQEVFCAPGERWGGEWEDVQRFLEGAMEDGLVEDGTIAQDSGQAAGIWSLREGITVALKHAGASPPPPRLSLCLPARDSHTLSWHSM